MPFVQVANDQAYTNLFVQHHFVAGSVTTKQLTATGPVVIGDSIPYYNDH